MKLLLFHTSHFCTGMKPIGLSLLKAYLQKHGHEVRIFDFAKYAIEKNNDDTSIITELGIFKPVKESEKHLMRQEKSAKAEVMGIILNTIDDFQPDLLGISLLTNNLIIVKEYFSFINEKTHIPIIIGGVHPTIAPEQTINLAFADMICIGYGEKPLLELLDSGLNNRSISNIWFKEGEKIIRNPVSPLTVDFENYEFPNWDDYSNVQFYKPFQGKVMRYGDVEFGRGCPHACTFCVVPYLREKLQYKCRKKRNEKMIEELAFLKKKYRIEIFRFWDELFLLVDDAQLKEFGKLYKQRVDLPFIIETTAESVTEKKIKILKEIGCVSASIGIESGNPRLRNKILNKRTANETFIEKFNIINEADINTTSYNIIGLPGETEEMIMETVELNKKCRTRTPTHALFYPYPGTQLRDYCVRKGYLEADFDDMVEESILYSRSVLKQDHVIHPDRLRHYLELFPAYCKGLK